MIMYGDTVQDVIDELGRLPGIGPKSAQRLAFHLLNLTSEDVTRMTTAINLMKEKVRFCSQCFNVAEDEVCSVCSDPRRSTDSICVVEEPRDVVAVERSGEFRGAYHVLGGALSPIDGIGPDQLRIAELLVRLDSGSVDEVVLATNPNIEGEATAMYLARLLVPLGLKVTKIASGLPVGGDLEYADELTLGRALLGRQPVSEG